MENVVILIPAYQPEELIISYVRQLHEVISCEVVIVNDGSDIDKDYIFKALSKNNTILNRIENRGKGYSLREGFRYILNSIPTCTVVVTVDADLQHAIADVERLIQFSFKNRESILFGVRDFSGYNIPWKSKLGNQVTSYLCRKKYHISIIDTQTGLRLYPICLIPRLIEIPGDRFDYEFAILIDLLKEQLPLIQLPITTIYENHNKGTHFRMFHDSLEIYQLFIKSGKRK